LHYLAFLSTAKALYPQIKPRYPQRGLFGQNLSIPYMELDTGGRFQPICYGYLVQPCFDLIQV